MNGKKVCWVCGRLCNTYVCQKHRGRYIYYNKQDIVALKYGRKVSAPQTMIAKMARKILKSKCIQEAIFPFNLFYRMDIVVPEHKLCIEYDGEQHFRFIKFFHKTKKNFEKRKKQDKIKSKIMKDHGWKVIRFNYNQDEDYIERKLIKWKKTNKKTKRR